MFKAKSLLAAVLGMGFSVGVVPDTGGGTTVDPNAAPAAPDVSASGVVGATVEADAAQAAQNTVGAVVGAVESAVGNAVNEVVQTVESFADKAKKYFNTKEVVHLSNALIPLSAAVDDLTQTVAKKADVSELVSDAVAAAVASVQATITAQAQSIADLQTQISTLTQKVTQATS